MAILRTLPCLLLIACASSIALADDQLTGVEPGDTVSADGTLPPVATDDPAVAVDTGVIDEGQPGDDSGSADDGAVDDGTVDDGYVDNTGDDGSVDDGSVDDGLVDDGTGDDGSIDEGTTDEDYADDGSTGDDGSVEDDYADDGTIDDGSIDDGTVDDGGTVDDEYADDGATDDGNIDDGNVDDGSVDDGGTGDEGTVDDDYADDGATDDGNIDDGTVDDGNVDDGGTGDEGTVGDEDTAEDDYAGGDEVVRINDGEIVFGGGIKLEDGTVVMRDPTAGGIYTVNTMGTLPGDALPPIMSPASGSTPPVDVMTGSPMAAGSDTTATPPAVTLLLPDAAGAALYQPIESETALGASEPIVAVGAGADTEGAASAANGTENAALRIRAGHLVATPN